MLLTERDWQWWFDVDGTQAAHLVRVQRALLIAGIDTCPETVLGLSRTVLVDRSASTRLRILADQWERESPVAGEVGQRWLLVGEQPALRAGPSHGTDRVDGRRARLCHRHGWMRRTGR